MEVTRAADSSGIITVKGLADLSTPILAKCNKAASFNAVIEQSREPVQKAVALYAKHCIRAFGIAERRNIASLNVALCDVDLAAMLLQPLALPPSLRKKFAGAGAGAGAGTAVEDPFGDLAPLAAGGTNIAKVLAEASQLKAASKNVMSTFFVSSQDKKEPHKYWIRVRESFAYLGKVMLFWLSHPVGSAGMERDFCGLTMVTRSFRRRRAKWATLRVAVLSHCRAGSLKAKLAAVVRR